MIARVTACCVALILTACASGPPPVLTLPSAPLEFREGDTRWVSLTPAETTRRGEWWRVFSDPILDGLVERAGRQNNGIKASAARLEQALAQVRSVAASRAPQLDARLNASRQGGPLINAAGRGGNLFNASAALSYEVDLLGRLARATDAAKLDAQAREDLLRDTRLVVQSGVAHAYFALRAVDAERDLLVRVTDSHRETVRLLESGFSAGLISELDVVRAKAEVGGLRSEILALENQRATLEHGLAVLVGEAPSQFRIPPSAWTSPLPVIPAGIPSDVLARRPDVAAAQGAVLADQARWRVANASWFPSFSLTTAGGYASSDLEKLFNMSARAWGLGALLALPVLDGGRRAAGLRAAAASIDLSVANYREQTLVAFREVEDQLASLRILSEQAEVQGTAVAAASRARELAASRHRSGLGSQLEVLDAQRVELRLQRDSVRVRGARYLSTIALVRALGGGWGDVETGTSSPAKITSNDAASGAGTSALR